MKNCIACNHPIADDAKFCPECGAEQVIKEVVKSEKVEDSRSFQQTVQNQNVPSRNRKRFPAIYTLLLVLAIIGPLHIIGITAAFLFFGFLFKSYDAYLTIGTIWLIVSLLTCISIILLMLKRKKGLRLYVFSQVLYIIVAVIAALIISSEPRTNDVEYAIIILFIIPAIIFLIIFRSKRFRKYLH